MTIGITKFNDFSFVYEDVLLNLDNKQKTCMSNIKYLWNFQSVTLIRINSQNLGWIMRKLKMI